jgi:MerR family mercuric resistance operon transcriptional regulator
VLLHEKVSDGPVKTKLLLIGQLARLAGVKPDSVRFYERSGLLSKPQRQPSGYRVYDAGALRRLRFIKQAQALGFTLDEINRILGLRGRGAATCRCVIAIAEATLSETAEKLRDLQQFHDRLKRAVTEWKRSTARRRTCHAEFCDLIEQAAGGIVADHPREFPKRLPPRPQRTGFDSGAEFKA